MDYAEYGRPGGKRVSPEEFIQQASPRFREKGIFPYCEACGQRVDPYGVHTPGGPRRFDHVNLPKDADPLDDCILANRNSKFKGMHPSSFDSEHGKQLRENFFDPENLKRTYCFMWKFCGAGNFPIKSLIKTLERADKKRIWSYSGIPLWTIPYILLTLDNFIHNNKYGKNYNFHFFIQKNKSSCLDDLWSGRSKNTLRKVFTDSGRLIEKATPQNPLPITEANFIEFSSDNSWIEQKYIDIVLKYR